MVIGLLIKEKGLKVELVAITKPMVDGLDTAQDFISYAARVSNPPNQKNTETGPKLLNYCVKHKHFSVFEMANMVVGIETTRDISRQILRHRSFSFQELSARYSQMDKEYVSREVRVQDTKNRQSSYTCEDVAITEWFEDAQQNVWDNAYLSYENALRKGVAKEQARVLLPEGLVKTRMYMNGSIRSWIHYCTVRCGVETQKEHRLIAKDVCRILIEQMPFLEEMMGKCLEDDYSAEN